MDVFLLAHYNLRRSRGLKELNIAIELRNSGVVTPSMRNALRGNGSRREVGEFAGFMSWSILKVRCLHGVAACLCPMRKGGPHRAESRAL